MSAIGSVLRRDGPVFDPEQSLRLQRSTGIPALPTVKTACSQRGIVPH
jgi:hypothetical protein